MKFPSGVGLWNGIIQGEINIHFQLQEPYVSLTSPVSPVTATTSALRFLGRRAWSVLKTWNQTPLSFLMDLDPACQLVTFIWCSLHLNRMRIISVSFQGSHVLLVPLTLLWRLPHWTWLFLGRDQWPRGTVSQWQNDPGNFQDCYCLWQICKVCCM